jgi:hypothetical protein
MLGKTRTHRWVTAIAAGALISTVVLTTAALAPPAAAARHRNAPSATAPPGYQIVIGTAVSVPPSTLDTGASTTCPSGTVIWGGGVFFLGGSQLYQNINTSEPSGSSGWEARVNNFGPMTGQIRVDAICANQPSGYQIVFKTVANPSFMQSSTVATCPIGTVALDGGTLSTSDQVNAVLTSAWPKSKTKFKGYMYNGTTTSERFTVIAICGQTPPGYKIVSSTASVPTSSTLIAGIACPASTSIIGGGAQVASHDLRVMISGSMDGSPTSWLVNVSNASPSTQQVTSYAICAA